MSATRFDPRLRVLLITPEPLDADMEDRTEKALRGGIRAVQLRMKRAPSPALVATARRLRRLTDAYGALLLVNGRVDVAVAAGADGVQLGRNELSPAVARKLLGARAVIGYSAHGGFSRAEIEGADYITFSPVRAAPGKGEPAGFEGLHAAVAASPLPVIALGGLDAGDVSPSARAGAAGVAVIRAVYESNGAEQAAAALAARVMEEWNGAENYR